MSVNSDLLFCVLKVLELYNSGEQWWLDQAGETILAKYNEQHVKTCPYKELISDRYIFPQEGDVDENNKTEWVSATEIFIRLDLKGNPRGGAISVASALFAFGAIRSIKTKKFLVAPNPEYQPPKKFDEEV